MTPNIGKLYMKLKLTKRRFISNQFWDLKTANDEFILIWIHGQNGWVTSVKNPVNHWQWRLGSGPRQTWEAAGVVNSLGKAPPAANWEEEPTTASSPTHGANAVWWRMGWQSACAESSDDSGSLAAVSVVGNGPAGLCNWSWKKGRKERECVILGRRKKKKKKKKRKRKRKEKKWLGGNYPRVKFPLGAFSNFPKFHFNLNFS